MFRKALGVLALVLVFLKSIVANRMMSTLLKSRLHQSSITSCPCPDLCHLTYLGLTSSYEPSASSMAMCCDAMVWSPLVTASDVSFRLPQSCGKIAKHSCGKIAKHIPETYPATTPETEEKSLGLNSSLVLLFGPFSSETFVQTGFGKHLATVGASQQVEYRQAGRAVTETFRSCRVHATISSAQNDAAREALARLQPLASAGTVSGTSEARMHRPVQERLSEAKSVVQCDSRRLGCTSA